MMTYRTRAVYKRIIPNDCHQIHDSNLIYIGCMVHRFGFDFPFVLHEYQIDAFVFNSKNMIFDIEE